MTLEEMLQQYLAAQLAKETKQEPVEATKAQPQFVTVEQLQSVLSGFAAEMAKSVGAAVAEQVEKALPVREPGAGRAGVESGESELEANPVAYLAKKARTSEGLSQDEKNLAWAITYSVISDGMKP